MALPGGSIRGEGGMMMRSVSGTARVVLNGACALLLVGAVTSVGPALAAGVRICLEAESGEFTKPMTLYKARDLSGSGHRGAGGRQSRGEGRVRSRPSFLASARSFTVRGHLHAVGPLLDRRLRQLLRDLVGRGRRATLVSGNYKRWHWVRGPVQLTAGTHELKILQHGGWGPPRPGVPDQRLGAHSGGQGEADAGLPGQAEEVAAPGGVSDAAGEGLLCPFGAPASG